MRMNHHPVDIKHDEGFTATAPYYIGAPPRRSRTAISYFFILSCFPLFYSTYLITSKISWVKRDMTTPCISPWLLTTLRFYELKR